MNRSAIIGTATALLVASVTATAGAAGAATAHPAGAHGTVCMSHRQFFHGLTPANRKYAYRTRAYPWGVSRVRCAGNWAVATATEGNRHSANAYTAVEHRTASRGWHEVDRARPCNTHKIPKAIYAYACDSN